MRGSVASRCRALLPGSRRSRSSSWRSRSASTFCGRAAPAGRARSPGARALRPHRRWPCPAAALVLAYRAHVREERQRSEVESLLAIMRDVHAAAGTEAAAAVLLEHARSLVGAAGAALVLHTAEGRVLRAQVDGRERARRSLTGETTLPERALFEELETAALIDLSSTRHERRTGLTGLGLPAAIVVALRGETRVVGLLAVERGESFSLRERRLLETVGKHAGSALESGQTARALAAVTALKERLAHEARHDPLTGLANRSLFSLRVAAALARDDNAPAVMFLDLDDFKHVNDTLGHAAGDALLVTVAERLRASLREDDLAARLGGDEFAVLLEHAPSAVEAERAAERVLGALLAPLSVEGHVVRVRASIGVALASRGASTADQLLRNADLAMYAAKAGGQVALRDLLAGHGGRRAGASRARERSARGHRAGTDRALLPAARRPRHRPQLGGRGARSLAPSATRPAAPRALHRAGRGDRPDQRARARHAARGLPSGRGLARDRPGCVRARRLGQRLAAPVRGCAVRAARGRRRSRCENLPARGADAGAHRERRGLRTPSVSSRHCEALRASACAWRSTISAPGHRRWPSSAICPSTCSSWPSRSWTRSRRAPASASSCA